MQPLQKKIHEGRNIKRFREMLAAGQSLPWQDTLEKLTGTRQMDASAITEYFAPLLEWLKEQNAGRQCGW